MTTIYTKTETDTLLNAKQATLTAATTLLGIGSNITALDYTKITLNKPSTFPADMKISCSTIIKIYSINIICCFNTPRISW